MLKRVRLSLADKCQVFFFLAVLLILLAALMVVGWRLNTLVEMGPQRRARDLAELLISGQVRFSGADQDAAVIGALRGLDPPGAKHVSPAVLELAPRDVLIVTHIDAEALPNAAANNPFLAEAQATFLADGGTREVFEAATNAEGERFYRYVRALRAPRLPPRLDPAPDAAATPATPPPTPGPLTGVLYLEILDDEASTQLTLNLLYSIAAGLLAGLVAIAVFWFITTRVILQPVRVLKGYAERVSEGDLSIRSDINTGDEFEQLSDVFNTMLETLKTKQDQLAAANKSLDLELIQLAESNTALNQANELKSEFLANVSHELRTPLNSIVGFAEVLQETLASQTGPVDEKRKRYAHNIIHSSRVLLEMINDLLDLAKIEAGKMEVHAAPVSVSDMCEGLITLITPLADKRDITLVIRAPDSLPTLQTDAGKLQRVLFNLLSNAVKFTPDAGRVSMTAAAVEDDAGEPFAVRFTLTDTGPGIASEDQQRIFEKFTQVDNSHTRQHTGTGLGLTIARDLTDLLGGTITVRSEPGKGATFTVAVPLSHGA